MGTLKISDISCSRSQVNSLTSAYTCTGNGNGKFLNATHMERYLCDTARIGSGILGDNLCI